MTVCGNFLDFEGALSTPTVTVTTTKLMVNNIISTKNGRGLCLDIKKLYFNNPLPSPEYMKIHISMIPQEIVTEYKLATMKYVKGWYYMRIDKGMYGLKQAGIISNKELQKHLLPYGYAPVRHTPGLWECKDSDTMFTLVVDDFFVKITSDEEALHLTNALKQKYEITIDWDAKIYIGITQKWWYHLRKFQLSIPEYVPDAIKKIKHMFSGKHQDAPAAHIPPKLGQKIQYSEPEEITDALDKNKIARIQMIVGIFLYYVLAIDNTILSALGDIASEQSKATENIGEKATQLLNYICTHPLAIMCTQLLD